ncbi:MAG: carbon-nitrogen hydrolase family protein [Acidobacteriota bacterium]|nr:carbon-nitrogen hydrolase family protein [Blastocatellia bacterium]MDW8411588.1 carbon-nitrogen hydrolase family protein [Acidobacteriota bacterium]
MKVAAIQMCSTEDVQANLEKAERFLCLAAKEGATLIALPENFAYLRSEGEAVTFCDDVGGKIHSFLARLAVELRVDILAGSIPERAQEGKVYNTSALIGSDGQIKAVYRKMHLFDAVLSDGSILHESLSVLAGEDVVLAEVSGVRVGLSICYDLRFPELYRRLVADGAEVIFVPAAFTVTTGRDHWEILLRARAIENQVYVVAPAQYGKHSTKRASYGRSMVVDPWGVVLTQAADKETVIFADLDLDYLRTIRSRMPCLKHRKLIS